MVERWVRTFAPDLKRSGAEWRGPCLIHGGTRDSFALNAETGQAYCHSECARGWSLLDLHVQTQGGTVADARRAVIGEPPVKMKPREVAAYSYTDENDVLVYQNVRYEPKDFRARRKGRDGEWVWSVKGTRRVLYRLSRVMKASEVYIVEGEKDVHVLEKWGLTATTNVFGAGKWSDEYTEALRGKGCVILPDNDDKGSQHAELVRTSLEGKADSVVIVRLPGLPVKGDVSDWVAGGGSLDALLGLVEAARGQREEPTLERFDWAGVGRRFGLQENGLVLYEGTHDGGTRAVWCSSPVQVLALTRNTEGGAWGKLLEFRSIDGKKNKAVIQQRLLLGDGKEAIEFLADRGFRMSRGKKQQDALRDFLHQSEPDTRILCTDRVGWHGNSYVLPDMTFAPPGEPEVIFDPTSGLEHKYNIEGTLDEWRANIGTKCAGNPLLVFAVAAAFAAPLLRRADIQGGGFHFVAVSSTGKTTILRAAGSVWGGARDGSFLDTWRATANGIEAKGMAHNDALLCLDEIDELAEKDAYGTIYMLANGGGKSRMTRGLVARKNAAFVTLFLSTGERTIADVIQSAGRQVRGGQEARLIQVAGDAERGMGVFANCHGMAADEFSRHLTAAAKRYYGSPIRVFLAKLAASWDQCQSVFHAERKRFVAEHVEQGAAGEVYRAANVFGVVSAAGVLASQLEVTGWAPGEAGAAAAWVWQRWIDARGGAGAQDVKRGVDLIFSFLMREQARFEELGNAKQQPVQNRAGFFEKTEDGSGTRFLLFDSIMPEILRGYDAKSVMSEARRIGLLEVLPSDPNRFTIQKRLPNMGRPRVYSLVLRDSDAAAVAPLFASDAAREAARMEI